MGEKSFILDEFFTVLTALMLVAIMFFSVLATQGNEQDAYNAGFKAGSEYGRYIELAEEELWEQE